MFAIDKERKIKSETYKKGTRVGASLFLPFLPPYSK